MTDTVVITGSGSGIGRAICTELADLGWRVIATDLAIKPAPETVSFVAGCAGQQHTVSSTERIPRR
jgi:NAD(P)-dependent dehydrogenase (short-subunit alcohol dehydrogenase family)